MRNARTAIRLSLFLVVPSLGLLGWTMAAGDLSLGAEEADTTASGPRPVDDDMHHFMEYVFEPNYLRLKAGMKQSPRDKNAWKSIKGDALTLAECANLLLIRVPDEGAAEWRKQSVAVRTHGSALYQAARASDYASAGKAYETMIQNCNACHQQFADGEHQLQPYPE